MATVAVTCIKNGRTDSFGRPLIAGTYYPAVEINTANALWNAGYVSVADESVFDQDPLAGTIPLDDFNVARSIAISRQPIKAAANISAELAAIGMRPQIPLPTNREIASTSSIDLGASSIPAGVTVTEEDDPNEFGGRVLKISTTGAVTVKEIILQFKAELTDYPVATPQYAWRIKYGSNFDRIYLALQTDTDTSTASKRYLHWVRSGASNSQFGNTCPSFTATKWEGQYRTYFCDRWFFKTDINAPPTWDENNPSQTIKAIRITIITTGAADLYFSRVYCPQWDKARFCIHGDAGYESFFSQLGNPMVERGWVGNLSRLLWDDTGYGIPSEWARYVAAGWEIGTHMTKSRSPVLQVDGTATAADIRAAAVYSRQLMQSKGFANKGQSWTAFYQNSGDRASGITGMVALLRSLGITGSRGAVIDEEYGIDPFTAGGRSPGSLYYTAPQHYIPMFGRFNRGFVVGGGYTAETKDTFSGSNIQTAMNQCLAAKQFGLFYFHGFTGSLESPPGDAWNTPNYARSLLSALDAAVAQGAECVTAGEIDRATYDRPGDTYLRWDGEWVSRATGKIAF